MKPNTLPHGDGVDRLLSDFFKADLPDPFPAFNRAALNAPTPVREPHAARGRLTQSRLALAASVALLLGGCWYLTGQMSEPTSRVNTGKGEMSAKMPKELIKAKSDNTTRP